MPFDQASGEGNSAAEGHRPCLCQCKLSEKAASGMTERHRASFLVEAAGRCSRIYPWRPEASTLKGFQTGPKPPSQDRAFLDERGSSPVNACCGFGKSLADQSAFSFPPSILCSLSLPPFQSPSAPCGFPLLPFCSDRFQRLRLHKKGLQVTFRSSSRIRL